MTFGVTGLNSYCGARPLHPDSRSASASAAEGFFMTAVYRLLLTYCNIWSVVAMALEFIS